MHRSAGTQPTPVELFPRRGTSHTDQQFLMAALEYSDPYDELLHRAALRMFQEELDWVREWKGIEV
jgi:hypothetical protein